MSEMFSGAAWYSGPVHRWTLVASYSGEVLHGGRMRRLAHALRPSGRPGRVEHQAAGRGIGELIARLCVDGRLVALADARSRPDRQEGTRRPRRSARPAPPRTGCRHRRRARALRSHARCTPSRRPVRCQLTGVSRQTASAGTRPTPRRTPAGCGATSATASPACKPAGPQRAHELIGAVVELGEAAVAEGRDDCESVRDDRRPSTRSRVPPRCGVLGGRHPPGGTVRRTPAHGRPE